MIAINCLPFIKEASPPGVSIIITDNCVLEKQTSINLHLFYINMIHYDMIIFSFLFLIMVIFALSLIEI